jgi:putative ABC transport system permease protein
MKNLLSSLWFGTYAGLREMRVQPLRSALSMTGVGLAIAAVTAIFSINGGLQAVVKDAANSMGGPGRFMVRSQEAANAQEAFQFSRSQGLRPIDGNRLQALHPNELKAMKSWGTWAQGNSGGSPLRVYLNGIDEDYLQQILQVTVTQGRTFEEGEFLRGDPVAMIGWTLAEDLGKRLAAHGKPLVGSTLFMNGVRYQIIGSFKMEKGMSWRYASAALVPWHTAERFHMGASTTTNGIQLQASSPDSMDDLVARVSASMKSLHRGSEDFTFQLFNFIKEFSSMITNITLLFSFVAALSLGVGALGILNVMLASLADRVREVGVQKALGAKPLEIGIQFLAESVTLSLVGGLLGLALGSFPVLIGDTIYNALHFRPILDFTVAFKALGITVVVGVTAGLFPAWKAMRLDPIEALRYE